MRIRCSVDQLRRYSQLFARFPNRTLQYVVHIEFAGEVLKGKLLVPERKRRGAGDNAQLRHTCQEIDQLFSQTGSQ